MQMVTGLQKQMSSMKCESLDEKAASNECLVKRIKVDKSPTFKNSNEKQFHFNEEVREKLANASASLATAAPSDPVEKAKEA